MRLFSPLSVCIPVPSVHRLVPGALSLFLAGWYRGGGWQRRFDVSRQTRAATADDPERTGGGPKVVREARDQTGKRTDGICWLRTARCLVVRLVKVKTAMAH